MQYDIQDLVEALTTRFPDATVALKPEILRGATACVEHVRIEFEGWKTALIVTPFDGRTSVGPASYRLKKIPARIERRSQKNTIPEIVKAVALWKSRYLKTYPVIERSVSVREIQQYVYNGVPLRDKYYV